MASVAVLCPNDLLGASAHSAAAKLRDAKRVAVRPGVKRCLEPQRRKVVDRRIVLIALQPLCVQVLDLP